MSKTSGVVTAYAPVRVAENGTAEIGQFFKEVRLGCDYPDIGSFAVKLGRDAAHLGRIEAGKRLPGAEWLLAIAPFIAEAQMDAARLMYLWLEAQHLDTYVRALRRGKEKR